MTPLEKELIARYNAKITAELHRVIEETILRGSATEEATMQSSGNLNVDKLIKLLNLSTSSNDNEALLAIRKANQLLEDQKWTWEKLLLGKITVAADPFTVAPPPVRTPAPPPAPSHPIYSYNPQPSYHRQAYPKPQSKPTPKPKPSRKFTGSLEDLGL